jgi:hypothetical protein
VKVKVQIYPQLAGKWGNLDNIHSSMAPLFGKVWFIAKDKSISTRKIGKKRNPG